MKTTTTVTGLAIMVLGLFGCSNEAKHNPNQDTLAVNVVNLGSGNENFTDRILYDGTLEANKTIELSFQVSGTILNFSARTGDYINKGQLVAAIDETIYRNQYNAQLAQVKLAKENYTRINEVFKKGSIAEIKMLEAKSNYEQLNAAAKATYQNLVHARLYSPVSGYVGEKKAEAGAVAIPGQSVLQLLDTRALKVIVAVPESEVNQYKVGTQAEVKIDALGGQSLSGKVTEVGVLALNGSANYNITITIANSGGKLKPGMLCKVLFKKSSSGTTPAADSSKVIVPVQSVQVDEKGNRFVYILNNQHKAIRKNVEVGAIYTNGISILSGLTCDEQIITSGYQKLADQSPVTINN